MGCKGSEIYLNYSDRLSYFNQLIIARKINDKLSVQIAPNHSHQNLVNGYFVKLDSATLKAKPEMVHDQFSISLAARNCGHSSFCYTNTYIQFIDRHIAESKADI